MPGGVERVQVSVERVRDQDAEVGLARIQIFRPNTAAGTVGGSYDHPIVEMQPYRACASTARRTRRASGETTRGRLRASSAFNTSAGRAIGLSLCKSVVVNSART